MHQGHALLQIHNTQDYLCGGCKTNGEGTNFGCEPCNFHMHDFCTNCPKILSSFLHPQHPLSLMTSNTQYAAPPRICACVKTRLRICFTGAKLASSVCIHSALSFHRLYVTRFIFPTLWCSKSLIRTLIVVFVTQLSAATFGDIDVDVVMVSMFMWNVQRYCRFHMNNHRQMIRPAGVYHLGLVFILMAE